MEEIAEYENMTETQLNEINELKNKIGDLNLEVDRLTGELEKALEEQFPGKMLPDIRFSADIEKAQVNQQTIFDYENFNFKSNAAKDYWTLIEKIEKKIFPKKGAVKNAKQNK